MTEQSRDPGRIDLRAIDEPVDPRQANRVIASALARARMQRESNGDVLTGILLYARPLLAIAAALLVIASGTLLATRGRAGGTESEGVLAAWVERGHVPTNGELLAAFQGYER